MKGLLHAKGMPLPARPTPAAATTRTKSILYFVPTVIVVSDVCMAAAKEELPDAPLVRSVPVRSTLLTGGPTYRSTALSSVLKESCDVR